MSVPSADKQSFTCPHCGALAHQTWFDCFAASRPKGEEGLPVFYDLEKVEKAISEIKEGEMSEADLASFGLAKLAAQGDVVLWNRGANLYAREVKNLNISQCFSCDKFVVWINAKQYWPHPEYEIPPASNMPTTVLDNYSEARLIYKDSPRAACALLRSAIECLCNEINGKNQSVFEGIGQLVKAGLDSKIQRALDVVRVTGNNAIHPGTMSSEDSLDTAIRLFKLVNIIVEKLINEPVEIDSLFEGLGDGQKEAIARRDNRE